MKYQVRRKRDENRSTNTLEMFRPNISEIFRSAHHDPSMIIRTKNEKSMKVTFLIRTKSRLIVLFLVPIRRTSSLSPGRRRGGGGGINHHNLAVIGPNEKFSNSHLYRLRQPVQENVRVAKPREYAILGRNEKFQDNVVYPLRKPIVDDDSSRVRDD